MLGRLAGAAIVMRSIPDPEVRALGDELGGKIVEALEARAVGLRLLGLAHGEPGVVLAALVWQAVSKSLPEDALVRAVAALYPYDVSAMSARSSAEFLYRRTRTPAPGLPCAMSST